MNLWVMILAAGESSRLRADGLPTPKQFLDWKGMPLYWHSAFTFSKVARVCGIVFVMPDTGAEAFSAYEQELGVLTRQYPLNVPWLVTTGGSRRQDSVQCALKVLPAESSHVLVHDSARPFVSAELTTRVIDALLKGATGVIPAIAVADTIKAVDDSERVLCTYERSSLRAVQTPQGFSLPALRKAHESAVVQGWDVTDDASLLEKAGETVVCVPGEPGNIKITRKEDLAMLEEKPQEQGFLCTGYGYDVHRFGGQRSLILGGVPIPGDWTVDAHSDGDVVLHALIDALLGCMCQGDIGTLFPDTNAEYEGVSSGVLLAEVMELAARQRLVVQHVDITIVAQAPKLAPYREGIARNVAKLLQLRPDRVNVKATTEEKLGFTGEKKGLKAKAVVTAHRF